MLGCDAAQTAAIRDALLAELACIDRAPLPRAENIAMPRREPVRKVEHFDTTQAKLCMLFTLGRPMQPEQLAAVRLAMALYGGSVTSENAHAFHEDGIDGVLVGGASLSAQEFCAIANTF